MSTLPSRSLYSPLCENNACPTYIDAARKDGTEEEADKTVDLRKLRSQIMNNRALACMNLKNFGMALRDINTVH